MSKDDITRKQALKQIGGLAIGSTILHPLGEISAFQAPGKPNILWIVSEDNSASYIHCYGNEYATTPNIDHLASEGILYENAFAPAPVCAPTRSSLITGCYANSMGTQHMRSTNPIPGSIYFYPHYLRQAGYYCSNNYKKDYNTVDQPKAWDESSHSTTYRNRADGQPFFAIYNLGSSHEHVIHDWEPFDELTHDPDVLPLPAYLPDTPEVRHDLAQYYDKIQQMDQQVGKLLSQLEKDGVADHTIVFYYSDHGGVLPRSKRYVFENGLHVPFIIRFPEKYQHWAPGESGTTSDRLVNFADLPPTLMSLVGADIPSYYQGGAFLGKKKTPEPTYTFGFRGRMDETYDKCRTVRDKNYRYIRNYMPNRIYGQHVWYLWKAASMQSWQTAYQRGQLNDVQSRFWHSKPPEELYDIRKDPDNVNNLADDPAHQNVLKRMRKANQKWIRDIHDSGFMPEAMMQKRADEANTTIYQYVRSDEYPQEKIISMAETATMGRPEDLGKLKAGLTDSDAAVRYWAAYGCAILKEKSKSTKRGLMKLLDDSYPDVAIAASEALYYVGEKSKSLDQLRIALDNEDNWVRLHALNVIRTFGKDAMPLLPKLQDMLLHPKPVEGETYGKRLIANIMMQLIQTMDKHG